MGSIDGKADRCAQLLKFYSLLDTLEAKIGGARQLTMCSGRTKWPVRGVYFFREVGESRSHTGQGPRVVRVGTHALKTGAKAKLWNRLSQHKGQAGSGGGNHRGSIFRLITGTALISRDGLSYPDWGLGNSAAKDVRISEIELERNVTQRIGRMPFLWIPIQDEAGPESLRGVIERGAIALLSNYGRPPLDPPSADWLGHHCDRQRVRSSGLWNSNHVDESPDAKFLEELERLIVATV